MGRRDTEEIQREEEEESFQLYSSAGGSLHPECPGTVRPFMRGCWKKEDWTENTRAETSKINREEGSSKSENTFFATVPQKSSRLISRDSLIVNTRIKRSIIVLARGSVYIRRRDRELHFAENIFLFLLLLFFFSFFNKFELRQCRSSLFMHLAALSLSSPYSNFTGRRSAIKEMNYFAWSMSRFKSS